jgi:hypothetical protein
VRGQAKVVKIMFEFLQILVLNVSKLRVEEMNVRLDVRRKFLNKLLNEETNMSTKREHASAVTADAGCSV